MQYKPILLVLSGFGAACLAFALLAPADTVTVEKKSFAKGRADVLGSDAERIQLSDDRPKFQNAANQDTGAQGHKGRKAGGRSANAGGPSGQGANMVTGGREGGVVSQRQAEMTPEQAEEQHQQAWRGMEQRLTQVASKHGLTSEATTQLSGALQDYMDSQKSLWDSVASGDMSQEEAMAASEKARDSIEGEISGVAGQDVADEMGGMLGGGAPGDAQGGMGQTPPTQGGMPQGGAPPGGGGMGPPPGGGGGPPPGGR